MVAFRLATEIRAPPKFVVDWWWDLSPETPQTDVGGVRREVHRLDERTIRLTAHNESGGHARTTDGTMTRTGPSSWRTTAHVFSGGAAVTTIQSSYSVEPTRDGSQVLAEFDFRGRTRFWRFVLSLSRYSLRRDRARALLGYARAIEDEFAAGRVRPTVDAPGTGSGPQSAPPG